VALGEYGVLSDKRYLLAEYKMKIKRTESLSESGPEILFTIGAIANGDVVLIYNRPRSLWGRVSKLINVGGQRFLAAIRRAERVSIFRSLPSYSHVMLGVGGGLVIHADGKRVSIDVISDVIHPEMNDVARFVVYRHQQLSISSTADIVKAAYRYYSQSYGFTPYFGRPVDTPRRKEDTTQFCSRLVAHAYRTAGHQLTTLADNRVLPLDLYRICQSAEWRDVTSDFVKNAFSDKVAQALGEVGLKTFNGVSLQDIFAQSEQVMREAASTQREFLHLQHKSLKDQLNFEAMLVKYVSLQFDLANASLMKPDSMSERVADWVKCVLTQLPALLDLAQLPDVEHLVTGAPNRLMIGGQELSGASAFVGQPAPAVVQQMQEEREVIRIYAYLLLANIGVLTIASWLTRDVKFERFASVGVKFGKKFLAVVPLIDRLVERLAETREGFLWIESEENRKTCRELCESIIDVLQLINVVRRQEPKPSEASEWAVG
jgi:hypothetical protein